jgi:hypothetical protein
MKKTLYVFVWACSALLALPAAAQIPGYVPTDGLVGWWPFNGNANDESGNGNDGVVNGATLTEDRNGNSNTAYQFNGSSYVTIYPNNSNSNVVNEITISGWAISNNGNTYLASKSDEASGDYRIIQQNDYSALLLNGSEYTFSMNFPINEWYHIAVTHDINSNTKIYINGSVSLSSSTNVYPPRNSNTNLDFGRDAFGLSEYHSGKLDDIAIFNRALTEQEIQNLYTGTTPAPCAALPSNLQQGLVGYWPFCGNANDESGNGNDGTVNGATLTEDRFGNANAAYNFDGVDDFIEASQNVSIQSGVTYSVWGKLFDPNLTAPELYMQISDDNQLYGGIVYSPSDSAVKVFTIVGNELFSSNQSIDSNWVHFVYTWNAANGESKFYSDGSLEGTILDNTVTSIDITDIRIGRFLSNDWGYGWYFNGALDDIGIWNRALTPEEVQELYTLDACTFTVYDTLTVYETVYDTVYTFETIYDTVTTYVTVTDTLLIDITFTGFEGQPSWLNTVTVFPNPASDHITIDYGNFALMAGYNTIITDASGATVYSSAVNSQQVEIDINAWGATGVYYMSVYDASGELVAVRHIVLE